MRVPFLLIVILIFSLTVGAAGLSGSPAQVAQALQTRVWEAKQSLAHLDYELLDARIASLLSSSQSTVSQREIREINMLLMESLPVETRAIWLDDIHMSRNIRTRQDVANYLDLLQSLNINVILPDVYGDGKTIYPSKVAPQHEIYQMRFPQEDLFQIFIEEAHLRGMEIHAWLRVFSLGHGSEPFLDRLHWLDRDIRGGYTFQGYETFLSPASPEAREYLIELIREISSYNIDGLHLDYIRYSEGHGYSDYARQLYMTLNGIDPREITYPNDAREYKAFKAQFVSSFVDRAGKEARAIKPDILVSAAVAPPLSWGKNTRGQDWQHWVRNRTIHFFMPMDYVQTAREYDELLDLDLATINFQSHNFPGMAVYAFDQNVLVEQWTVGRNKAVTGQTIFSSLHLNSLHQEVLRGIFRQPAMPTLRYPVQAALAISENLRHRLWLFGPEIALDPVLLTTLLERLSSFETQLQAAPIRSWETRDLQQGDVQELAAVSQLLDDLRQIHELARTLPARTRDGVTRDLEHIRSLLQPLQYTSTPFQYRSITD